MRVESIHSQMPLHSFDAYAADANKLRSTNSPARCLVHYISTGRPRQAASPTDRRNPPSPLGFPPPSSSKPASDQRCAQQPEPPEVWQSELVGEDAQCLYDVVLIPRICDE
jgi:hypothetical protein